MTVQYDIVVPTVGRPSLHELLRGLAAEGVTARVLVVDDRVDAASPLLPDGPPPALAVETLGGRAAGPAAARNIGWRAARCEWVVFLDDDVVPAPGWGGALAADLASCPAHAGGSQGKLRVPLPPDRRATDWERNVAGLESARWATADMAYRRSVLAAVNGFDERFPRAYREDADLALRIVAAGWSLVDGRRCVLHPVRPVPWHVSVTKQAGNADDALMDRIHGPGWRQRAHAPHGRRRRHVAVTVAASAAVAAALARRPGLAAAAAVGWLAGTAEFAWRRIAPGPRTVPEVAAMVATSAAIPFAATGHWLGGLVRARRLTRQ